MFSAVICESQLKKIIIKTVETILYIFVSIIIIITIIIMNITTTFIIIITLMKNKIQSLNDQDLSDFVFCELDVPR